MSTMKWRPAKGRNAVVSDDPPPPGSYASDDSVEFYGGNLIAESIAPAHIPLIAAAPDMLAALKQVKLYAEINHGSCAKDYGEVVAAAIAKAEGK